MRSTVLLALLLSGCFSEPGEATGGNSETSTSEASSGVSGTSNPTQSSATAMPTSSSSSATFDPATSSTSETSSDSVGVGTDGCEPGQCVPDGAIAFYPFEDDAADQTGNGHDGVMVGAVGFGAGRYGQGLINDGSEGAAEVAHHADLDLASAYTVEAWLWPNAGAATTLNVLFKGDLADAPAWAYRIRAGRGVTRSPISVAGAPCSINAPTPGLLPDTWYHLAWSWDGAMVRLYVNAEEVHAEACGDAMPTNADPLHIGRGTGGAGAFALDGALDNLTIFGEARDAPQICADAEGTWDGACTFL